MNIKELATYLADRFEKKSRIINQENIWVYDHKDWFKEVIFESHQIDDMLPNDFIYHTIKKALDLLSDNTDNLSEYDELHEYILENLEADIYTKDLIAWTQDFSHRVDDTMQECGKFDTLFDLLSVAQLRHKEEISLFILNELNEYLENNEGE